MGTLVPVLSLGENMCLFRSHQQTFSNAVPDSTVGNSSELVEIIPRLEWFCGLSNLLSGWAGSVGSRATDREQTQQRARLVDLYSAILSLQMKIACSHHDPDQPVSHLDEDMHESSEEVGEDELDDQDDEQEQVSFLWQQFLHDTHDPFEETEDTTAEDIDASTENWAGPSTANFVPSDNVIEEECDPLLNAGATLSNAPPDLKEEWCRKHQLNENLFSPFKSELDWRVADWVVRDSPSNSLCDRLLKIPGVMHIQNH